MKLPILKSSDVQKPSKGQSVLYINKDDKKLYSLDYNGNILKFEKDFPIDIKNVTISNNNAVLKGNFFIGKNDAGEFELFEGNVENHGNVEILVTNSMQRLNPGYYESIIIPAKPEETLPETSNGSYSLLCVTSYKKGYDKIYSFEMSDFPADDPDMGMYEDLRPLNGTYTVTDATKENDEFKRIYTHINGGDTYYFHYIEENNDYGSFGWAISKNTIATDAFSAICLNYEMPYIIEGSGNWSGEMNMVYASATILNINKTYIDNEIVCKYVTGQDEETLSYSFSEETITLSQYEVEPIEHYCYFSDGTKLIGNSVGNEGGQHLLSYVKGDESDIIETVRSPRNFTIKHQLIKAWQYPSYQVPFYYDTPRISSKIIHEKSGIGTWSDHPELTIYDDTGLYKYESRGRMEPLPFDFDDEFTVSMFFDGFQSGFKRRLFSIYFDPTYNIKVDIDSESELFNVLLTNNDEKIISHPIAGYELDWSHIALTNNVKDKKIILYLNGMQKDEYNYEFMVKKSFAKCTFKIGRDDGNYRLGYYREIKLFDVALTPSQVYTDYNEGLKAL